MKINNAAAAAAAAPAFVAAMTNAASKADNANLAAAAAVLLLVRDSGGTNKKSMSALWALLPDDVVTTFQQVKRVNGALNAATDKATEGAKLVRPLWLNAKTQTSLVKGLLELGISSPRGLLDLVAPRGDKKEAVKKGAVDTFMQAAEADGFSEDITPVLTFIAERHAKQMQGLLKNAERALAGALKDAEEKQATIAAKAEKAKAAKAAKDACDAERTRKHMEALAEADKKASAEKSAQAKKAHEDKIKYERATHPKVRDVIEA